MPPLAHRSPSGTEERAPSRGPRSPRILYLTPGCFDKGGISRYTRYQIRALREIVGAGRVRVLSLLGPDDQSFEEPFAVDFHARGSSLRDKTALLAHAAIFAARERPDLVIAAHVNLSAAAVALAAPLGADTWLNVYGLEVWSGLRGDAALGIRRVAHVIADCHFTARWVQSHHLTLTPDVRVVWDCVDIDRFSPRPPRPAVLARYGIPDPATGINVLTLGRISSDASHKGYDRLLEAFARARATLGELRLIIAGRGPLTPRLREQAARLGVAPHVFFTGGVHEDDLADVYRAGHIFSLVSYRGRLHGEGLPLSVLEAAACGLPILVGNQDGSQEAVVEGRNGHVLDPFDIEAHAGRLRELARAPAAREAMGAAGRVRAEREFSYGRFVDEHRALLDDYFGGFGGTGRADHAGTRARSDSDGS
jgi:phosphatidylinositol alpha-1,6-mannosyltransferase